MTWQPAGGSVGAPTDTEVRVELTDYPDPDTVSSGTFTLTTGGVNQGFFYVAGAYAVDLAGKAVTFRPASTIAPELSYEIRIQPSLRSLAGCAATPAHREFETGGGPAGGAPASPPALADVQAVLQASCAGGCHLGDDGACSAAPAAGLSLCATDTWGSLVGVPSAQAPGLELVAPYDSGHSYVVRKLLPATDGGGPVAGNPGERDPPGEPLDPAALRTIEAWIDAGALH